MAPQHRIPGCAHIPALSTAPTPTHLYNKVLSSNLDHSNSRCKILQLSFAGPVSPKTIFTPARSHPHSPLLAELISLEQMRLRGQLIEVFKYLNEFTTASARRLFDCDLNDRTRNNGAKLIVKHFNTSVVQPFYPIKITSNWNALPSEVVSSRTENSFKNSLDKHWAENPPNVIVNW